MSANLGVTSGGDASSVMLKKIVTRSWNNTFAKSNYKDQEPKVGPFRLVTNSGDYLSRQNYSSGGPNAVSSRPNLRGLMIQRMPSQNDGTAIESSSTNVRYVYDSSDYVNFKKQRMTNLTGFPKT
jgi:hypothetical protein